MSTAHPPNDWPGSIKIRHQSLQPHSMALVHLTCFVLYYASSYTSWLCSKASGNPRVWILSFGFWCFSLLFLHHQSHCLVRTIHLAASGWIQLAQSLLCKTEIWFLRNLEWIWSAGSQTYKCLLTIYTFRQVLLHSSPSELCRGGTGRKEATHFNRLPHQS